MAFLTSADGTSIAYQRAGTGPAVILIGGGLDDGSENAPLARELAEHFTVYNFARRGRGGSGDTPPYAVEREIEDLAALITEAGGSPHLFGASSGGMFALEAAAAGLSVGRVAVYEVPYDTADDAVHKAQEYREQLGLALAEGRRADAVGLFMRLAGSSESDIATAMNSPYWLDLEVLAHTLAYDAALYGPPPTDRLSTITQPTLVATGGSLEYFEQAANAVAASLAHAERQVIEGQAHVVDPKIMAAVLTRFFRS
ncbi:MAG: hydrolase [Propionibacteriaceae bacterium]|jgi:pimeloyl-ACP methyl ester carboxylesterase|nr:hydrolase [Propionibacteriaceae bacterium]